VVDCEKAEITIQNAEAHPGRAEISAQ
jgi:hypothetical protein